MDADGGNLTHLTDAPAFEYASVWSPDGTRIVFQSSLEGTSEIYRMNADGGGLTNLTNNPADDRSPAWSPAASAAR